MAGQSGRTLTPNPPLDGFIDRLADYMGAVPTIAHHAADHVSFLGSDPDYYAAVFPIERIADFARTVQEIIGRPLMVPRAQNYGPKFDASMLSRQAVAAIRRHYEPDYDIWGRHF